MIIRQVKSTRGHLAVISSTLSFYRNAYVMPIHDNIIILPIRHRYEANVIYERFEVRNQLES